MIEPRLMEGGVLALTAGAAAVLAGPVGLLGTLLAAGSWIGVGVPAAIATLWIVALVLEPVGVLVVGTGAAGLAVVSIAMEDPIAALGAAVAGGTVAVVAWAVLVSGTGPVAAGVTVLVIGAACYAVHRYELVTLGLVGEVDR